MASGGAVFDFLPIWIVILGLAVFFYVLLDGFDLGVGILYGFAPDANARRAIMNSIAPIWEFQAQSSQRTSGLSAQPRSR